MHRQIKFVIWFPVVIVTAFAAGYLFWQKTLIPGPYDLEPMPVVRNHRATGVDTSDWQTYRNEEYGFEIKYPVDWGVDDYRPPGLSPLLYKIFKSYGGRNMVVIVEVFPNEELLSIKQWIARHETECLGCTKNFDESSIQERQIGTLMGYEVAYAGEMLGRILYFPRNSVVIGLDRLSADENGFDSYNQILSTFRFITAETQND